MKPIARYVVPFLPLVERVSPDAARELAARARHAGASVRGHFYPCPVYFDDGFSRQDTMSAWCANCGAYDPRRRVYTRPPCRGEL